MNPWEQEVTPHEEYGLVDDINDIYKAMIEAACNVVKSRRSISNKHMFMKCLAQDVAEACTTALYDEVSDSEAIDEYKQDRDLFPENIPAVEEFQ